MSKFIMPLTAATFDEAVASTDKLILVDFMADWCAPCKQMAPILEDVAEAYEGQLFVVKVDADESPAVLERFGVRGLPTLMILKNGVEAERAFTLTKTRLVAMIDAHLVP